MDYSLQEFLEENLLDHFSIEFNGKIRDHKHKIYTIWSRLSQEDRLTMINSYNFQQGLPDIKESGVSRKYIGNPVPEPQYSLLRRQVYGYHNFVSEYKRFPLAVSIVCNTMENDKKSNTFKNMKLFLLHRGDFNVYPFFRDYDAVILHIINMGPVFYKNVVDDPSLIKKILDDNEFIPSYVLNS